MGDTEKVQAKEQITEKVTLPEQDIRLRSSEASITTPHHKETAPLSLPPHSTGNSMITDTVLMGQFNFAQGVQDVLFWYTQWKRYFQHVVVFGPFQVDVRKQMENAVMTNISGRIPVFHSSDDDAGYYSPMWNLARTMQLYKNDSSIKGVIYAHDDALLNLTYLQHVLEEVNETGNLPPIILASFDTSDPRKGLRSARRRKRIASESYSIHYEPAGASRNATIYYTKVNGQRYDDGTSLQMSMKKWRHEECIYSLSNAIWKDYESNNIRARKYMEPLNDGTSGVLENKTEFLVPPPSHGGSDFLYMSISLADAYTEAAALFYQHKVFLECGFPKIIDILRHLNNATVIDIPLCTKWGSWVRDTSDMLRRCNEEYVRKGKSLAVIHPYKLSTKSSKRDWALALKWVMTNALFVEYARLHDRGSEGGVLEMILD